MVGVDVAGNQSTVAVTVGVDVSEEVGSIIGTSVGEIWQADIKIKPASMASIIKVRIIDFPLDDNRRIIPRENYQGY